MVRAAYRSNRAGYDRVYAQYLAYALRAALVYREQNKRASVEEILEAARRAIIEKRPEMRHLVEQYKRALPETRPQPITDERDRLIPPPETTRKVPITDTSYRVPPPDTPRRRVPPPDTPPRVPPPPPKVPPETPPPPPRGKTETAGDKREAFRGALTWAKSIDPLGVEHCPP